jgi:hypothetical protein
METVSQKVSRQSWARLIQEIYGVELSSFGKCQNYTVYVRNV